ncbi:two pore channel protein 1-like [Oscarella lobularis]|uniref:two pore channel protein 1-like n=1 Tax=Oscarella lobularis TaxID=121494 RepID=UPI003313CB15
MKTNDNNATAPRVRSQTVGYLRHRDDGSESPRASILASLPARLEGRGRLRHGGSVTSQRERSLQAAIYLQEGEDNDKFTTHPTTASAVKAYRLVHNHIFWTLDLIASLALIFLAIVEPPAVITPYHPVWNVSRNRCLDPKSDLPEKALYRTIHTSVELVCLCVIALDLYMKGRWLGARHFLRHKRTVIKLLLLAVMMVETVVIVIRTTNHVRVTRALRPFFLLDTYYCQSVRRVARQILQSLLPILDIVILLLAFILFSSLLAFFLFLDIEENVYFVDLWTSFVSLFILLTTANFPTVMMPVFNEYWWAPIFFILYLCIGLYLIMNLLLAVVYSTFSTFEKKKFNKLFLHKREALCRAYDVLCGTKPMNFWQFQSLLAVYRPRWKRLRVLCVFRALDESCTGNLSLHEFLRFYDVRDMTWKMYSDNEGEARWYTFLKNASARRFFRRLNVFVQHRFFRYVINASLLAFTAFIIYLAVKTGRVGVNNKSRCETLVEHGTIYWINVAFLIFYAIEALLKIVGLGPKNYFTEAWHIFDFLCVLLSSIGMIADFALHDPVSCTSKTDYFDTRHAVTKWLRYLFYVRILRLIRLFQVKKRYREVLGTLFVLLPRLLNVVILILLLYYFFAIIGMEAFPGLLCRGCCKYNDNYTYLRDAFGIAENYDGKNGSSNFYYLNNFDNILSSYVLLFEQMIVNNWYIAMNAYVIETGTEWTRVYFMLFFLVSSVVVAIVISFILDAFMFRIESQEQVSDETQAFGEGFDVINVSVSVREYNSLARWNRAENRASYAQAGQYRFKGMRRKTKADFRLLLYAEEIQAWVEEQEEKLDKERSIFSSAGELTEMPDIDDDDDAPLLLDQSGAFEEHFNSEDN